MAGGIVTWHFECRVCGMEASDLIPAELADADEAVNEADREAGLESLRRKGFDQTFRVISRHKRTGTLLDVGCAHGWFLDAGRAAGFDCIGIEPSIRVAARGAARGHTVRAGYFPSALEDDVRFDVVAFNDVYEHIPGADSVMQSVARVLADDGILSIAIPSSRGFFYRLSKVMARAGIVGPFERMWQKQFSSPHLYYFRADALAAIANRHGLERIYHGHLPSVRLSGLWDRLAYDERSSRIHNAIVYVAVVIAMPFLAILPADIDLIMFRKRALEAPRSAIL